MKPARLPGLFAATLIALMVVLFNLSSIFQTEDKRTNRLDPANPDQELAVSAASSRAVTRAMANTGPGWGVAIALPSPTILPSPTLPARQKIYSPAFQRFIDKVADGQKGVLKGIYIPGIFKLSIVQQPKGDWAFVSEDLGTATEFQSASRNGVTGLLAHNYLSGELFYQLKVGDEIRIVYGDRAVKIYLVEGIYQYQKLTPSSPQSDLIDLETNERVTTEVVFNRFYRGDPKVTLQTCLERYGLSNWGLTFVVASPIHELEY